MGGPLQKKKNRSSLPKVRHKPKSKRLNIRSNPIVAANWNSTQTLSQNYTRLGLTSKLNARAGGVEPRSGPLPADTLSIAPTTRPTKTLVPGTARIVRDAATGAITSVIHASPPPSSRGRAPNNPLNDPLNEFDASENEDGGRSGGDQSRKRDGFGGGGSGGIVRELEAAARNGGNRKRPRMQSRREEEWVERLVRKWGEDFHGMVWDRRLNPGQQSEGDLRRRVRRWRAGKGGAVNVS